jgi:tRNA(Arg) A34 adenosine deaminase TadA
LKHGQKRENVTKLYNRLAKRAKAIASEIPGCGNQKVVAFLHDGRSLIAEGYNQEKTHPLQARFGGPFKLKLHAEIDCIAKAASVLRLSNTDFQDCTLYVFRVTKAGKLGLAKPCRVCQSAIGAFKIGDVVWS